MVGRKKGPGLPGTEKAWSSSARRSSVGVGAHFAGISVFSAGLNEVTVGLIGFKGALSLLEAGFSVIAKSATELAGAIAQLGGARGLQQMLTESVTNQGLANQTRFAVTGDQRLSNKELMDLTAKLSEDTSAGAYSRSEWLSSIKQIGIITGNQKSLDQETLTILGQVATVTGSDLLSQAKLFGSIQAAHPTLGNQGTTNAILAGMAIGQTGSFNIAEIPEAGKLMQLTSRLGGMEEIDKLKTLFSIGTIMKPVTGDLETSGVQLRALMEQARKSHSSVFHFNDAGEITNINEAMNQLANTRQQDINPALLQGRSGSFIGGYRHAVSMKAGVEDDDFSPRAKEERNKVIEQFEKLGMSTEELNRMYEESLTPQQRFMASFNRIADNLEVEFLQSLQDAEPAIEQFASMIIGQSGTIGGVFDELIIDFANVVAIMPNIIDIISDFGSIIGTFVKVFETLHGNKPIESRAEYESTEAIVARDIADKNMLKDKSDLSGKPMTVSIQKQIAEIDKDIADRQVKLHAFENRYIKNEQGDYLDRFSGAGRAEVKKQIEAEHKEKVETVLAEKASRESAQKIVDTASKSNKKIDAHVDGTVALTNDSIQRIVNGFHALHVPAAPPVSANGHNQKPK